MPTIIRLRENGPIVVEGDDDLTCCQGADRTSERVAFVADNLALLTWSRLANRRPSRPLAAKPSSVTGLRENLARALCGTSTTPA